MTALYLLAAILGVGLLAISAFGGDDAGDAGELLDGHHGGELPAASVLVGILSLRNLTFFLAAFGVTGLALTLLGVGAVPVAALAAVLGLTALGMAHGTFAWLRRSDLSVAAPADADLAGALARVVVPLEGERPGRVVCTIGGRELHLTARLADPADAPLPVGREALILDAADGTARVVAAAPLDLPPTT